MKISILIPAHNEEKSIKDCVQSCLNQKRKFDQIVIVNDKSSDKTLELLKEFKENITIINLTERTGNKSGAQEKGMKYVNGDIVVTTDADTLLDNKFAEVIEREFSEDENLSAVCGYVQSLKHNIFTSLRELEYVLSQDIHKYAQSAINSIFVLPGCASAYKREDFNKYLIFEHDTLTEDLDFTYKLHTNGKRIKFVRDAIVYTQDPSDFYSLLNQLRRWYAGNWQNLRKHWKSVKNPIRILEYSILYIETFFTSFLIFIAPFFIDDLETYFFILFASNIALGLYASIKRKRIDLLLYSPFYIFNIMLNCYVFIEQFVKEGLLGINNKVWFTPKRRALT